MNNYQSKKKNISSTSGFTLIEIIIVLGVITIIAGLGLANFQSSNNSSSTYSASRDIITSDFRLAANKALNSERFQGQEPTGWGVKIAEGTNSYTIFADLDGNRIYDAKEKYKTVKLNSDLKVYPSYGSTITGTIFFNTGDAKTYFNNTELTVNSTTYLYVHLLNKNNALVKTLEVTPLGTVSNANTAVKDIVQPSAVTGLVAWYKADALTGLTDGAPVSSWTDSSGTGRHITQATGAAQPTYIANGVNYLPVVRFDGVDDYLRYSGSSPIGIPSRTVFVVMKWIDPTMDWSPILGNTNGNTAYFGDVDSSNRIVHQTWSWSQIVNGLVYNNGAAMASSTLLRDKLNFQLVELIPTTTIANTWLDNIGLSYLDLSPTPPANRNRYTHADYAEVIIYNTVITETERKGIEAYLSYKYNIPLSY